MLMPIIAAVGSFVVSERILKPKATALFILACLAAYDLFISPPTPLVVVSSSSSAFNLYDNFGGKNGTTVVTGGGTDDNNNMILGGDGRAHKKFQWHEIHGEKSLASFQTQEINSQKSTNKEQQNQQQEREDIEEGEDEFSEFSSSSNSNNNNNNNHNFFFKKYQNYNNNNYEFLYQEEQDDLATSLRCYRGPALLAIALFCSAYSLRIWRRNGVACDELLFLPGTPHEFRISNGNSGNNNGDSGTKKSGEGQGHKRKNSLQMRDQHQIQLIPPQKEDRMVSETSSSSIIGSSMRRSNSRNNTQNAATSTAAISVTAIPNNNTTSSLFSEGDAAAGASRSPSRRQGDNALERGESLEEGMGMEMMPLVNQHQHTHHQQSRRQSTPHSSSEEHNTLLAPPDSPISNLESPSPKESPIAYIRERTQSFVSAGLDMLVVPELRPNSSSDSGSGGQPFSSSSSFGDANASLSLASGQASSSPSEKNNSYNGSNASGNGKTQTEIYDAEYAPSGPSVLGAALDLSLPVLFNFHMFVVLMKDHYKTEAEEAPSSSEMMTTVMTMTTDPATANAAEDALIIDETTGKIDIKQDAYTALTSMTPPQIPPKVLPLIFLSATLVRSQIPRKQRMRFYKTIMEGTVLAPFRTVNFRDAFVGDCMTSLVRPIADVVFTLSYYGMALYGLVSQEWDLNQAGYIVSNSKLLHGLMLPLVAMLPLWFRFLQTLRQAYDSGKRWPYLGNALKYFMAGLVVLYGMTHSTGDRGVMWVVCFTVATIYQAIWDAVMDWELLVIVPKETPELEGAASSSSLVHGLVGSMFPSCRCPSFISSLNPRWFPSTLLGCLVIPFRRRISQPIANSFRKVRGAMPRSDQIRLRPQRLFDDDSFYWRALFGNAALRFCWMMNFIPAYRVSILDGTTQETFEGGSQSWSFVILAALEIFRRCIWGIIKVELETIKLTTGEENDLVNLASTADEYLREGMWNVWRKGTDVDDSKTRGGSSMENDLELVDRSPRRTSFGQYSPVEGSGSGIFTKNGIDIPPKQSHRWLGFTVSSGFLRWAYFVELSMWPLSFLVLSYYVVLMD